MPITERPPGPPATTPRSPTAWFPGLTPEGGSHAAPLRLICVPYAGGTASVYRGWEAALGTGVRVVPVALPGRGLRLREPPYSAMRPLARDLADALTDCALTHDYALFGHSMGALIAYETAREMLRRGLPGPVALIVSGRVSPQSTVRLAHLHDRSDAEFAAALLKVGGTPDELFRDDEIRKLLFPLLRADFALNEEYEHQPGPRLACPLTVLGGTRDARVPVPELAGWAELSSGPTQTQLVAGGHFFVAERRLEVLGLIREALGQWIG